MKNINIKNLKNISLSNHLFKSRSFLALAFLFLFSPVLFGISDAKATCTGTATGILNTADGYTDDGHTAGDSCSADDDSTEALCAADTGCIWGENVTSSTSDNAFVNVTCRVMKIATGPAGKTIGAIAIISTGIGFFFGKTSWGLLITVGLGIGAIFGSASIVGAITGDSVYDCSA